jgi:ssDNA-binding Zn-finger/Zn-ribbon topoisomerase 1
MQINLREIMEQIDQIPDAEVRESRRRALLLGLKDGMEGRNLDQADRLFDHYHCPRCPIEEPHMVNKGSPTPICPACGGTTVKYSLGGRSHARLSERSVHGQSAASFRIPLRKLLIVALFLLGLTVILLQTFR